MLHYPLFLAAFDYELKFRPSSANSNADFLSRFPLNNSSNNLEEIDVHEILHLETVKYLPVSLESIQAETQKDPELLNIMRELRSTSHTAFNSDYSIFNDVLVRGTHTVIPASLHKDVLSELHEGHLGISKMKNLAR